MKLPISWLNEYLKTELPVEKVAERLTMAGLEVEEIEFIGAAWDNICVAAITAVGPHPNADRLRLATVDTGVGEETVVCGAPNLNIGDKVAFARVGASILDSESGKTFRLKETKIRGVPSAGMVCSESELGISDSHEGILVLPFHAPLGMSLADYLGDVVMNIDITPNRPDCLCVMGVVRETAALTGCGLDIPEPVYEEKGASVEEAVKVGIEDADLCSRYCASLVRGVKIAPSPDWMKRRLAMCGVRSINNVVDITNYVMLEYGQPLHAFDYEAIRGGEIIVRRASHGEKLTTLDGEERKLTSDMLVIADKEGAVAVAGVMGGASSEVGDITTSVLLEAANFKAASIHHTSRELGLPSEASYRFERGIRPDLALPAIKRATQLILELAGGEAAVGVVDAYPGKEDPRPISVSPADISRLIGVELGTDSIADALTSLGFQCRVGEGAVEATAPYWRSDIARTEDLIEEVMRVVGYDAIPFTMISGSVPQHLPDYTLELKRRLRAGIVGCGFQETITYSLIGLTALERLVPGGKVEPPLRVANPMTVEQEYLRPNLRVGLLTALAANRRYQADGIRLFELGKVYLPRAGDLPQEPYMACAVAMGLREDRAWHGGATETDIYDIKGVIERLMEGLGLEACFIPSQDPGLHPDRQAVVVVSGGVVGVLGEVHPKVCRAFDIEEPVYLFELDIPALLPAVAKSHMYSPISPFPTVTRDIALVLDSDVSHQTVLDIIKGFPLVVDVALFDVYSGKQVPAGKKSLAYSITFQSQDHTLKDEEVNKVQQKMLKKLSADLGATLRA